MFKKKEKSNLECNSNSFSEKMISINRVTKVMKGGRILAFSVLAVVGDGNGFIGVGKGHSKEVPIAMQKAVYQARKHAFYVSLNNKTLHHKIYGKYGSSLVFLSPARDGTGIIAGGPIRAMCNVIGIQNIFTKSYGSNNPHNVVKAVLNGFNKQITLINVSMKRGKSIREIFKK